MHHSIEILGLTDQERALLETTGLSLQCESHQWLLQQQWIIHIQNRAHVTHTITGSKMQCLTALRVFLSAIASNLSTGQQIPAESEEVVAPTFHPIIIDPDSDEDLAELETVEEWLRPASTVGMPAAASEDLDLSMLLAYDEEK